MQLYREDGPKIFQNPAPNGKTAGLSWAWKNRKSAANSADPLRSALTRIFQDQTLKQLHDNRHIALCIPAVTMSNHQSRVFKTPHLPQYQLDNNQKVVDVCLATSAAPIVLPLASLPDPDVDDHLMTFSDGGLWANNPVLVGLIEALEIAEKTQPIHILSISTCAPPSGEDIPEDESDWGLKQWKVGINALETALDAQSSGYNFMAQKLIRHRVSTTSSDSPSACLNRANNSVGVG
jgi:patatin-like phospholipase/acyl hydrolase